jgi:hypothetical protein
VAAQDVAELVPRVRRAIYGPTPPTTGAISDDGLEAMAADAIADIILFTNGTWGHTLLISTRDGSNAANGWSVDPPLELQEETVVVAQAALTFFFHEFKDKKVQESITQDGRTWSYTISAQVLKEQVALLRDQRDRALAALTAKHPVLARYVSTLQVRDQLASAILEPWVGGGGAGGGILLLNGGGHSIDFIP